MAIKMLFGSIRGGIGRTTISNLISLLLQQQNRKTLLIDLDPSAAATHAILNGRIGRPLEDDYIDVYEAMQKRDLRKGIRSVTANWDLFPSSSKLRDFPRLLTNASTDDFISDLVGVIEKDYDFILFDVSSMLDELHVNALVASDYVIPILDTTDFLIQNTTYLEYVEDIKTNQNESLQVLGIVASLVSKRGQTETSILETASAPVKDLLFETVITDNKEEGKKPVVMYQSLMEEIFNKLERGK